ncbi:MAG: hypothetical protein JHC95_10195 [Solirubrobacteraceae bacterium]|nr:hypothetical protein [Solirubrobacteraceae bacterium]
MAEALLWGAIGASSLVIGALLGLAREWPKVWIGVVLAFGAGALISAVSFDLAEEGAQAGGYDTLALGLGAGALTYFSLDWLIDRSSSGGDDAGTSLALGAFLDGIPEQMVLGIGLAAGEGVGMSLLVAIFVSNLPEAIGSVSSMREEGRRTSFILGLWGVTAVVVTAATVVGYLLADVTGGELKAAVNGFAAGALLVMLVDSMIPSAYKDAGRSAGLVTVLGFAVGAALSGIS